MTNEDLIAFKRYIEKGYETMCGKRAEELAELSKDNDFDPYSFFGGRKIEKISKKYQEDDDGFAFLLEEVLKELKQRQISLLDLELDDVKQQNEKLSDEEYIIRELEKNKKFKHFK